MDRAHPTLDRDAVEGLPALAGLHCGLKTWPGKHDFIYRDATLIPGEPTLLTTHRPDHRFDLMLLGQALLLGRQISAHRLGAGCTNAPQEALSDRASQGRTDGGVGQAHVGQPCHGAHSVVRVYGSKHEVSRHSGL